MEVNAVNGNGFTALDIIQHMPRDLKGMEIRESLAKAGALSSRNLPALPGIGHEFMGESGITMVIENPNYLHHHHYQLQFSQKQKHRDPCEAVR